ncbi:MAG: hypothetical protein R2712_24715 [Vicinamibacterales bacterium]
MRGEITFFRNDIRDFIFRTPLSDEEFEAREEEFDARFGVEHEEEGGEGRKRSTVTKASSRSWSSLAPMPCCGAPRPTRT